jgi:hypothetical protein
MQATRARFRTPWPAKVESLETDSWDQLVRRVSLRRISHSIYILLKRGSPTSNKSTLANHARGLLYSSVDTALRVKAGLRFAGCSFRIVQSRLRTSATTLPAHQRLHQPRAIRWNPPRGFPIGKLTGKPDTPASFVEGTLQYIHKCYLHTGTGNFDHVHPFKVLQVSDAGCRAFRAGRRHLASRESHRPSRRRRFGRRRPCTRCWQR